MNIVVRRQKSIGYVEVDDQCYASFEADHRDYQMIRSKLNRAGFDIYITEIIMDMIHKMKYVDEDSITRIV